MQLYYYKARAGNVGDDLNAVLWPRVFGKAFFSESPDRVFIGIGSVFDNRPAIQQAGCRIVFGSGVRGRHKIPSGIDQFDIRFVRGPYSAKALGVANVPFISDPAIIAPTYIQPRSQTKTIRLGYVPYFMTPDHVNQAIAAAIGAKIIPPTLPVQQFIDEITSCETILSEAMHGAILADAYRIPWAGCRMLSGVFEGRTNAFKWNDWMHSLSIKVDIQGTASEVAWTLPMKIRTSLAGYAARMAVRTAQKIVEKDVWTLSEPVNIAAAQQKIHDQIEKLKADYPLA